MTVAMSTGGALDRLYRVLPPEQQAQLAAKIRDGFRGVVSAGYAGIVVDLRTREQ